MRIAVALIMGNEFPVPPVFVISWTKMLQTILTGSGNALLPPDRRVTEMNVIYEQGFPLDFARNKVCRLFLDEDHQSDYLLFLDVDMTHPPDAVHRLLRHGVDIVTGRYVMKRPPFFTVAMRKVNATDYQAVEKLQDGPVEGLVPIDAGGVGCLLLSRRVLTAVRGEVGDDWFRYQDGPDGLRSISEDMWFYEHAKAAGFQPWLDADLICGHARRELVTPADHQPYAAALRKALAPPVDDAVTYITNAPHGDVVQRKAEVTV